MGCALAAELPHFLVVRTGVISSDDGQEGGIAQNREIRAMLFACIFKYLNIGSFNLLLRVHLLNFLGVISHLIFNNFILHIRCSINLFLAFLAFTKTILFL